MKLLKKITMTILGVVFVLNCTTAQNYKAPAIDANGKVTNKEGKAIGSVNTAGEIKDTAGIKVAYIDSEGNLIDVKTGKKMGKAMKNGNFTPYFNETRDKGMTISAPMNGICQVKDADGKIVAEVHENYKQFGACAMHCLQNNMNHSEMLDKSKKESAYSCPMHADMVSDKPGKCGKCGMNMKKK